MAVCEKCGKVFEKWEAEVVFESVGVSSLPVHYDRFGRSLCCACAIEEYQSGNYFETCECCEKLFYPESELLLFEKDLLIKKLNFSMYDFGIQCAACAQSCIQNGAKYAEFRPANTRAAAENKERLGFTKRRE